MQRREFLKASAQAGALAAFGRLTEANAASAVTPGRYPFGLSDDQEKRAARLHRESIVFDAMFQGAGGMNIYDHYDPALLAKYTDPSLTGWAAIGQASERMPWVRTVTGFGVIGAIIVSLTSIAPAWS